MTGVVKHAGTWALVPLKSPALAKSRLAAVLSPARRRRLFLALAERTIMALRATPGIDGVAVVTASPSIADFSRALHARTIVQGVDAGMAAALEFALCELQPLTPDRVLMVPGDLPLISPGALAGFLASAGQGPGVAIVSDRRSVGTNLLLCTPPHAVAPCFGGDSFKRHLVAARAVGFDARVLHIEALQLDLDEPQDLEYLYSQDRASAVQLFEAALGERADADDPVAWPRAVAAR